MMRWLVEGVPRRSLALLLVLLVALIAAPWLANDYLLTVLITILYFAYTGQAWNVMMGFAGQLSLGHAIYVGLGAYATAALYVHFGIGPWLGLPVAIAVAVVCGAIIGFLAFRFGVAGGSPSSRSPSPSSRASASTISRGSAARAASSCRSPTTPATTFGTCAAARPCSIT